ncbi:hypothetical protein PF003_g27116 [Phytophthora fragariae]|nr:hypothetical protein PF003_g27116 [Phytophthora fragariae]
MVEFRSPPRCTIGANADGLLVYHVQIRQRAGLSRAHQPFKVGFFAERSGRVPPQPHASINSPTPGAGPKA